MRAQQNKIMKYTEKQIEKFKEMLRNGILKQLEEYEHVEIIDNIIELNEATILASCSISTEELDRKSVV